MREAQRKQVIVSVVPNSTYSIHKIKANKKSYDDKNDLEFKDKIDNSESLHRKYYFEKGNDTNNDHEKTIKEVDKLLSKSRKLTDTDIKEFNDPNKTVSIDAVLEDNNEISEDIAEPKGISIPSEHLRKIEDIVQLDKIDKAIRPYIKTLFIDKYSKILARGAMDSGDLSLTLGEYDIVLRKGEQIPRFKKVYYLSPSDTQHLKDILEFLLKHGVIRRAPINSDDGHHLCGSPSYLVPRKNLDKCARLVIDYSQINQLICQQAPVLPTVNAILHSLRGAGMFTQMDFAAAYHSLGITERSKPLSQFSNSLGNWQWNYLPTGMNVSCLAFNHFATRSFTKLQSLIKTANPYT